MRYINIIAINDKIISEKIGEKERQLVVENTIELAKVAKMLSLIDFDSKYMWAISNANIDAARDLGPTHMKKYWRHAG